MSNVFKNLKTLRKRKGKTQEEVCTDLGLKKSTYSNYETGHTNPGIDELVLFSEYFGVSLDDLLKSDIDFSEKLKASVGEKVPGSKYKHVAVPMEIYKAETPYGSLEASELLHMLADRLKKMEADIQALTKKNKK